MWENDYEAQATQVTRATPEKSLPVLRQGVKVESSTPTPHFHLSNLPATPTATQFTAVGVLRTKKPNP